MIIGKEDPCSHQERQGKQGSSWAKYDDIYIWKCNNENHYFAFYRLSLKAKKGGIMFHYFVKLYCETHNSPSMKSVPSLLRIVSKLYRRSPNQFKMLSKSKRKPYKVSVRTQSNGWSAHGKSRAGRRASHIYSELGGDSWAPQSPFPWCQSPMANHTPKTQNREVQKSHREHALCCFEYRDGSFHYLITFPRMHFFLV